MIPSSRTIETTPPLYYMASYGILPVVRYLLDEGVSTEIAGGRCSATPINIAAFRGHADVVKLLLDRGANPLAIDDSGLSAVDWARSLKQYAVREVLASAGYKTSKISANDEIRAYAEATMLVQSPYH